MYKLQVNPLTKEVCSIWYQDELMCIPMDPANRDAEEFALWLKSGNVPEPAEEGGTVTPEWIAETIAKLLPNA